MELSDFRVSLGVPYTQKVFISTKFLSFSLVEVAHFESSQFHYLLYMLQWRQAEVAKIKIANLPDKLKSVKLFTS